MRFARFRWQALLCMLALPLCALVIRPWVESGIDDDWSYIRMVQELARTGHLVYNGWENPMLGWQLFLGAVFVKLFGFSFTAVRGAVFAVGMATAFLMQRTLVRAGLREWNATVGTLAFVLSPLYLPLTFTFMTDVSGFFVILLCFYQCLRALQAGSDSNAVGWICFAAATNAVGGTVRQIAWLGTLVILPSTLWLMRRHPRVLRAGVLAVAASGVFMLACADWFAHQPYALAEEPIEGGLNRGTLVKVVYNLVRGGFEVGTFALPVLLMYLGAVSMRNRRALAVLGSGGLFAVLFGFMEYHHANLKTWLVPNVGDWVTARGLDDGLPIAGVRPDILHFATRFVLTYATVAGLLWFLAFLLTGKGKAASPSSRGPASPAISRSGLLVLLGPFTIAYIALLAPRATSGIYDRYLFALLFVCLLASIRLYQDHVRARLPAASLAVVGLFAMYTVAADHDLFAMFRARLEAIEQMRAAGVPATAIDGGFEFDGWTQIEKAGYINDPRIRIPAGAYVSPVARTGKPCGTFRPKLFPAVVPRYAISFDPDACMGTDGFEPVLYSAWLGPHRVFIYTVKAGDGR